ncbi:unnamed protein product [Prorocentrum cordatum]|uniref:Amino acid transporter n=1 Tax=Prorocentrum cordatum TaxID=2364126 RepID=A0ABN9XKA3_9DINO|nr:unnamed protein product [Polarella glacialis]
MPSRREVWEEGGPQLCFGELLNMGQYVVGLSVSMLLSAVFPVPKFFGFNLPMAFVGGHSNCFAVKDAYVELGWDAGKDACLLAATSGLVGGVVFGVLAVNFARWSGRLSPVGVAIDHNDDDEDSDQAAQAWSEVGVVPVGKRESAGSLVTDSEGLESMALQAAIVFACIFLAYIIKRLLLLSEEVVPLLNETKPFSYFPFFSLAILAGMVLNSMFKFLGLGLLIDRPSIERISGLSLELLVLCAIANTDVSGVLEGLVPLLVLIAAGFTFTAGMLFFVAPHFFTDYSYQRGFFEFGCCCGTTPIGLLLLNMVDPDPPLKVKRAISIRLMIDCPIIGIYLAAAIVMLTSGPHGTILLLVVSCCKLFFWLALWYICFRPRQARTAQSGRVEMAAMCS